MSIVWFVHIYHISIYRQIKSHLLYMNKFNLLVKKKINNLVSIQMQTKSYINEKRYML